MSGSTRRSVPVRRDEVEGANSVGAEPVPTPEDGAVAAAHAEPDHPDLRIRPADACEAVRCGRRLHLCPAHPRLEPRNLPLRVDHEVGHRPGAHQDGVLDRLGQPVPGGLHRDGQARVARVADRGDDVVGGLRGDDRSAVREGQVGARRLLRCGRVVRQERRAGQPLGEPAESGGISGNGHGLLRSSNS